MTHCDSLLNEDWETTVTRLGGADALGESARATKAFAWGRKVLTPVVLLRLVLAYCLGDRGLRSTAAWSTAVGLADLSDVALLYRLRQCGNWLAVLVGQVLAAAVPQASQGRLIRILDGTTVPKAGRDAKRQNQLWRVHGAFDLPAERFGDFVLTDEHGGEQLDRIPVVKGEIRLADRAFLQPDRIASVLQDGGDVVIRAGWRNACWLDADGQPVDLQAEFRTAADGLIDRPIWIRRKRGAAVALRLIALRKSDAAAAEARRKARHQARKEGYQLSQEGLAAADWILLVTSLSADAYPTDDVLALYRLRWRIELAFKRLKSLVGLKGPPGHHEASAKPYVLAHLLMILLLEPHIDALEDSPRWAKAA
jgi:Transposase DDE domain